VVESSTLQQAARLVAIVFLLVNRDLYAGAQA
jgi:hypothetical protein